jgi:transcriptional regulator with XRE-family HTH domain
MLSNLLLARRIELGLSQEMIARKVGVRGSTVSKWETNKIKGKVPIPTIHKMSIAYDLSKLEIIKALPERQREILLKLLNSSKNSR